MLEDPNTQDQETDDVPRDEIKDFGIAATKNGIHSLSIIGQIEGHYLLNSQNKTTKYEHILPALVAIDESEDIRGLIVLLNTIGGDVEAGLAIAEMIASMRKPTVSLVLGGGHSIGVPLAVSAKKSFIVPSATMIIHPVRSNGLVIGVPQSFNYFEKMQERITKFVVAHSKISSKRFRELITNVGELVTDVGSMLDGCQAVEEGLIDSVGGLREAIDSLEQMIKEQENKKDD